MMVYSNKPLKYMFGLPVIFSDKKIKYVIVFEDIFKIKLGWIVNVLIEVVMSIKLRGLAFKKKVRVFCGTFE